MNQRILNQGTYQLGYAVVIGVFLLGCSSLTFGAASKKAKKPTPTTKQLYGEQGTFKGGQTIASLPRLAGK